MHVRTPHAERLAQLLEAEGATIAPTAADQMSVTGVASPRIGEIAASGGVILYELTPVTGSLEDAYMELTRDEVEYHSTEYPHTQTPAEANR